MFFNSSDSNSLDQECAIIAERWNWSHEQIRSLETYQRRRYIDIIIDMYDKEKEAYNKK